MMQVTMVTRETPEVNEVRTEGTFPVRVQVEDLILLLTLEAAEKMAEQMELVIRGLRPDDEFEGPLPEYSPVRE